MQQQLDKFGDVKFESLTGANARKTVLVIGIMAAHAVGEGCGVGVSFCGSRGWAQVRFDQRAPPNKECESRTSPGHLCLQLLEPQLFCSLSVSSGDEAIWGHACSVMDTEYKALVHLCKSNTKSQGTLVSMCLVCGKVTFLILFGETHTACVCILAFTTRVDTGVKCSYGRRLIVGKGETI